MTRSIATKIRSSLIVRLGSFLKVDNESKTVRVILPSAELGINDIEPKTGWERISEFRNNGDNVDGVWRHLKSYGGKYTANELEKVFPKHFRKPWQNLLMRPSLNNRDTTDSTLKK